jgi:hypothetical protein
VEFTLAAGVFSEEGSPAGLSAGGKVRIEIAGDRNFTRSVTVLEAAPGTDAAGITAELPAGSWWWRAYAEGEDPGSAERTGQFTVAWTPPPQTISPAPASVYYYRTEPPALRFQWTSSEEVQYYILEAADNPGMANPVLQEEVHSGSLVSSRLGEGQWYWRVIPVFPAFYQGSVPPSPAVPFTIRREEPPPIQTEIPVTAPPIVPDPEPPEPPVSSSPTVVTPLAPTPPQRAEPPVTTETTPSQAAVPEPPAETVEVPVPPLPAATGRLPANGYVITPDALRTSRNIVFSWNPVAGADGYIFTLLQENASGVRRLVAGAETFVPSYTLVDLSLLDYGSFIWQVEAISRGPDGVIERRGTAGGNRFTVDIPAPETPRGRDTGILYGR